MFDSLRIRSRAVPLASFTAVMGIIGSGLDLRLIHAYAIGDAVDALGIGVFVILTARWLLRIRSDRREIADESARPSTASLYGTIVISLALIAAASAPSCVIVAQILWFVATVGGIGLLLYLLGSWIQTGIDPTELTPALFLPVVGNAVCVYVAAAIGVEQYAWFSFSLAIVCWMALLPFVLYRLVAIGPRMPRKLAPQLAILVASPAVLANAWYVLNGGRIDDLLKILACASLFFALLTIRSWRLAWGEPFNVAMWGWAFPAAALAGCFERIALTSSDVLTTAFAVALLGIAIGITSACAAGVLRGWQRQASLYKHSIPIGVTK